MSHNILITGASGYLGGTLLARWPGAKLPPYDKLFALVRTDEQAKAVKQYGATPVSFNPHDEATVREGIVGNKITVVYYLINALGKADAGYFIRALAEVKKSIGGEVHFLFTSGAKLFSNHAGSPIDRPLLDTDPKLFDIQKNQKTPVEFMQKGVEANNFVIEEGDRLGVRTYIFAPCIVYGEGEGFGNKISIQTVAIVKAAKATRRVHRTDPGKPTWPVCHVIDNTNLYLEILRNILSNKDIGYGKNGYYLASPGSVAWDDLYDAMAVALAKRGVVDDAKVETADDVALEKMAAVLGYPGVKMAVPIMLAGTCTFTPEHGKLIGWKPIYKPEHAIETADQEVELILKHI